MRGSAGWFAVVALAAATGSIGVVTTTSAQVGAVPRPPQFLLLSYDNDSDFQVVDQLRGIAQRDHAKVTFFMSGVFMFDWEHRNLYQPPDRSAGSSSVGFQISRGGLTPAATVVATVASLRAAQTEGDEVGTHFMGHFCGPTGVNTWSQSNWTAEIAQWNRATSQVDSLMGLNTGGGPLLHAPLGGRTPCLEGDPNAYLPAYTAAGYNYDSSSVRSLNQWPSKQNGVWRFGIPSISTLDGRPSVLAADYNFWVRYGDDGSQAREDMIYQSLLNAFESDYNGNRAPFEAVAHTTVLMGGAFYRAEDRLLATECGRPDVRCGTYSEAVKWLDAHAADLPALQAGAFTGEMTKVPAGAVGASAALVNLAMVDGVAPGYITADKCSGMTVGSQSFSNGNYPSGRGAVSNLSVVPVDPDGSFCVYSQTATKLVADVQGSFAADGQLGFTASSPSRVLDTRSGGRVAAGSLTRVAAGVVGAQAALVNVAMADATSAGYVTADKCSRLAAGPQSFSNGNYAAGRGAVSNLSVVPVDGDGSFCVYASSPVQLVVDVQGSFATAGALRFTATAPARVLDTRVVGRAASITRVVTGAAGADAALVNVAMTDATSAGYLTADKCSRLTPGQQFFSNGNYPAGGGAVSNLSVVPMDADGSFCVYTSSTVQFVVDVQGSFATNGTLKFTPATPRRVLDTRS